MSKSTFLWADKRLLSSVQPLVSLQLTTLDECFPAVWVVTQIRPLSYTQTCTTFKVSIKLATIDRLLEHKYNPCKAGIIKQFSPVCVLLWAWRDFSLGNTRLQMLQRMRLDEVSPSLMSSLTVSALGRPLRIPSWQQEHKLQTADEYNGVFQAEKKKCD